MKKPIVCTVLLIGIALLAWAAGPTIQAGLIILNGTTLNGAAGGNMTFQNATDTIVGRATTDTLTHKTFDTAGAGNVFKINTSPLIGVSGSGTSVLSNTASSLTASPATSDNSNKVATTAYVQNNLGGLAKVYDLQWAHTATAFVAPPTTAPTTRTLLQADLVANAEFTIRADVGVEDQGGGPANTTDTMTLGGISTCAASCVGASCVGAVVNARMEARLKVLTTGAGGTAKIQCFVAVTGGSANGLVSAMSNAADTTFAINTTANVAVGWTCSDIGGNNVKCHYYDSTILQLH